MKKIIVIVISICLFFLAMFYLKNFIIYQPNKTSIIEHANFYYDIAEMVDEPKNIISEKIKTSDGILLDTLFLKNNDSKVCVIYFHGNAGKMTDRFEKIKMLYNHVSVLIFDYRCFGNSSGGLKERIHGDKGIKIDAQTVYDYALNTLKYKPNKISFYGESLGAAVALDLASNVEDVHSIILFAPFYSLKSMIKVISKKMKLTFAGDILGKLYGQEWDSATAIQKINENIPIIIIHSPTDEVIPFDESVKLHQTRSKTTLIETRGQHNEMIVTDNFIYRIADLYEN